MSRWPRAAPWQLLPAHIQSAVLVAHLQPHTALSSTRGAQAQGAIQAQNVACGSRSIPGASAAALGPWIVPTHGLAELSGGGSGNKVLEAFVVFALCNCAVLSEAQLLEIPAALLQIVDTSCECQSTQAMCHGMCN
jgi:hypothetical protein